MTSRLDLSQVKKGSRPMSASVFSLTGWLTERLVTEVSDHGTNATQTVSVSWTVANGANMSVTWLLSHVTAGWRRPTVRSDCCSRGADPEASTPYQRRSKCTMEKVVRRFCRNLGRKCRNYLWKIKHLLYWHSYLVQFK